MLFFEKKTELITLLPERLREVEEFKLICECEAEELDKANGFIAETVANTFVPTAGEDGLSRWEKILGVFTPLGTTVKARREAVLAKLMTKPPINLAVLKGIIEAYMGVAVEITVEGYRISVKYRGEARVVDIAPLFVTLYSIIPANMTAEIGYKFLIWKELDGAKINFNDLDLKIVTWQDFEKGVWLNG